MPLSGKSGSTWANQPIPQATPDMPTDSGWPFQRERDSLGFGVGGRPWKWGLVAEKYGFLTEESRTP